MGVAQGALALLGLALGAAGIHASMARLHAEIVSLNGLRAAQNGRWVQAQIAAERAQNLRPQEYRYVEQHAAAEMGLNRPRRAQRLWHRAITLRPNSPYAWAQLASVQFDARIGGPSFENSLEAVAAFGPHERGLQRLFAAMALEPEQQALPAPVRTRLDQYFANELRERRTNLVGYALVNRRELALCERIERKEGPQKWCASAAFMRKVCDAPRPLLPQVDQWCTNMVMTWKSLDYPTY